MGVRKRDGFNGEYLTGETLAQGSGVRHRQQPPLSQSPLLQVNTHQAPKQRAVELRAVVGAGAAAHARRRVGVDPRGLSGVEQRAQHAQHARAERAQRADAQQRRHRLRRCGCRVVVLTVARLLLLL